MYCKLKKKIKKKFGNVSFYLLLTIKNEITAMNEIHEMKNSFTKFQ